MSGDDDIERLLAEIDSTMNGPAKPPAQKRGGEVTPAAKDQPAARGRVGSAVRTGGVAAAVCGVGVFGATFLFQWLPIIDNPVSSGLGAAVGAFLTGATLGLRRR